MKIPFIKMSGAGNDFVVMDRRAEPDPADWKGFAPILCDRHRGIGADGLIVLQPASGSGPLKRDFTMEYFNADGTTGSMCGNGGRCAAAYFMEAAGKDQTSFDSCGLTYNAFTSKNGIVLGMNNPGRQELNIDLNTDGVDLPGHFIDSGSPHLVLLTDNPDFENMDILEIGREIRHSDRFAPSGTNVDYVKVTGEGQIAVRTYERGVESETLACGTGAVASAIIYAMIYGGEGQRAVRVTPRSKEQLFVTFRKTGHVVTEVHLEGPAVVTFSGTFDTETIKA